MRPFCTLLALLGAAPAHAERMISLHEALEAAEASNPTLARSALDVEQAQASLVSSKGIFDANFTAAPGWNRSQSVGFFQGFPYKSVSQLWNFETGLNGSLPTGTTYTLSGGLAYNNASYVTEFAQDVPTESIQDAYTTSTSLSVRQQLLRGVKVGWNMSTVTRAREGLTLAELTRERTRQETLADTASKYWSWVYAEKLVTIAEQDEEIAKEALRIGVLRLESGELAPVEKTRLEAALVQAQGNVIDARLAAERGVDAVLLQMGLDPGIEAMPSTPIGQVKAIELDESAAVEVALAQNLDIAITRASLESARLDHALARHGTLPVLAAVASIGVGSQADTLGDSFKGLVGEDAYPYLSAGAELSVPIGNRAARGESDRTAALLHAREIELVELERLVTSQVGQQVMILSQASRRVELTQVNVRLAEETLAAEEALERAGRAIQKDVLEARTELTRSKVEEAKARADYRIAQTELLRLQGQLDLALP